MAEGGNVRLQSMPFTFYDVVGYLGPGIVAVWALVELISQYLGVPANTVSIFVKDRVNLVGVDTIDIATAVVIGLVLSYTAGILIGLFSSISVEKLAIVYFGYPSDFIREELKFDGPFLQRSPIKNVCQEGRTTGALFVQLLCFPLTLFIWFATAFGWFAVIFKTLPVKIISIMERRFMFLSGYKINFDRKADWFRFVCFYVINNNTVAFLRMYNYLTLYGFLRNMTFLLMVVTWVYFVAFLTSLGASNNYVYATALLTSWLACSGLFCGFLKFYRRYTEEAVLAFALMRVDEEDVAKKQFRV